MARFLGLKGKRLGSVISAVCGLCFLCFGYAQGVMGGLLTVPAFLERFPQVDTINNMSSARNAMVQGAVVGTWNLGCFVSALLTIFLGDYLGRKKTLMMGLTFWVIGEIVQCSSYSFGQFIAGRFIAGFGNGFTTSTLPAYQAECVKSHRKGTILMISAGAFIALGLALSYWLVFAFAYLSNSSAIWRVPIAFQIIFAVVAFAILVFLPESPRWLILTGREQEALEVLAALNDEDIDGPEIRDEFLQIKDAILVMSQGSTSSLTSNKDRRNAHRVVLAYGVQVFQQISGINLALQYLALMLYTEMSYTGWVARLIGACAATEYFLASFVTVVGIDRFWGRRSLMMFGAAGMCLCMILLTVMVYLWKVHAVGGTNIAATVFLFGFSTFFAIGWQGMAWLYQVEVVPLRIRGAANALSTSGNWLVNFVVVFIAPIAFHNIGYRTYIIFACTNFAIVPLIYFLYPETAYRSLEEVDVLFHIASEEPGNPWLNVVRISKEQPLWFGRKGDVPFDYEKSQWHQHYTQLHSSGTTLASDEKGSGSSPNTVDTALGSVSGSGSDTKNKGSGNESGSGNTSSGGGRLFSTPESDHEISPTSTGLSETKFLATNRDSLTSAFTATTATFVPSRQTSKPKHHVQRTESYNSTYSNQSAHSAHSAHSDPDWVASGFAPMPLHVPSRTNSAHTNATNASRKIGHTGNGGSEEDISYPGRIGEGDSETAATGIHRTESGRETYYADGVVPDELEERPKLGSRRSSLMARDAGRAY
ncbi:hypothetical protein P280DRAFT_502504 [Massarina eburnea CBS 473.64]|uniref:Major facilitator superfamily (MFS) profile domain-containing protein n=1 Tax=Massarina eburnea CBS 473.64 TaxID=1395130 RepID=A0A6A6RGA7_9PLEO|nr:hypothetical protein P280DRAFT_502504 [Massarina eburnea CBS 473.64]